MRSPAQRRGAQRRALRDTAERCREKNSRLFMARLLLTLEQGKAALAELLDAIGPLDQWVASDHAALLAD